MNSAPPTLDETLAHAEWVRRLARSLVSDADADDLAQDAWEAALAVDSPSRGWFAGALRNLASFRHRTTARRVRREAATVSPEAEPGADVVMERLEAQRQLTALVSALPETTRTVVYLRYFEGLDATAIGARLQVPAGTVRWRLKQGLDALRAQLDASAGGRERWSALLVPLAPPDAVPLHLAGVTLMKLKHVVAVVAALVFVLVGALLWRWPAADSTSVASAAPKVEVAVAPRVVVSDPVLAKSPVPAWRVQTGAPHRKVAGRVMRDGAPLPGAVVTLTMDEQPTGVPPQERVGGPDGAFDFGVQPAVPVGVGAFVAGHAPSVVELDLRNPEAQPRPEGLELVVPSGCPARLTGRVLDSGAGPVVNATVRPARTIGARSDASGAYELCLPRGENELVVEAAGYGAMSMRLTLDGSLRRDVVLSPEAVIEGVVVDGAGRPVVDALVSATQRMWQNNDNALRAIGRSDAAGRFGLNVAPGDYRVRALADGTGFSTIQVVSAEVGERGRQLTLVVLPGVRVRGVVMSGGKPVSGARVSAHTVASGRAVEAYSQRDGRFVLDGVPPGELVFTAAPWAVDQPTRYVAKADAPEVTLQVQRMAVLRGVVTREKKPVVGAQVSAGSMWGDVKTVSDAQGRYTLEGLARGAHQLQAVSDSLGAFTYTSVSIKDREERVLDLELGSAAFIDGTLVDEKSQPIEAARVVWTSVRLGDTSSATTDARGRFHVALLSGGDTYAPQVFLSGQISAVEAKPASGAFPKVKLADGAAKAEHVRLQVKVEKLKLRGRVVDLQGNPVADAKVRAKPASDDPTFSPYAALPQVFTDAQGRFQFEALQSGTWALQARSTRGEEATTQAEPGEREVVITVRPVAVVEGKLVGYRNTPVVYAREGHGRFISGQVIGETFRVVLAAGTWTITAMDNVEGDVATVTLKDGETRPLTLQSHGTGKLKGRLVDFETGAPVPRAMCRVLLAVGSTPGVTNWEPASAPMSDEDGRFVFESAPAGHVMVGCLGDEAQSGGQTFLDLPRGGEKDVTVKVVVHAGHGASGHGVELASPALVITGVQPDSPAAKAGLQAGDALVAVDGVPVLELGPQAVFALLDNRPPGAVMTVGVERAGTPINAVLTLPP